MSDAGDICATCGAFTFLPFLCGDCGQKSCQKHRFQFSHNCDSLHSQSPGPSSKSLVPKCLCCKQKAISVCESCGHRFCANHRFLDQHNCTKFLDCSHEIRKFLSKYFEESITFSIMCFTQDIRSDMMIQTQERFEDLHGFLSRVPPSKPQIGTWAYIHNPAHDNSNLNSLNINHMKTEFHKRVHSKIKKHDLVTLIGGLAQKYNCLSGKWMVFVTKALVDETWTLVAQNTATNQLGISAKVSLNEPDDKQHLICIYTKSFLDFEDCKMIGLSIRKFGYSERMIYKPDILTHLEIYRGNPWKLRPSLYSMKNDSSEIELVNEPRRTKKNFNKRIRGKRRNR